MNLKRYYKLILLSLFSCGACSITYASGEITLYVEARYMVDNVAIPDLEFEIFGIENGKRGDKHDCNTCVTNDLGITTVTLDGVYDSVRIEIDEDIYPMVTPRTEQIIRINQLVTKEYNLEKVWVLPFLISRDMSSISAELKSNFAVGTFENEFWLDYVSGSDKEYAKLAFGGYPTSGKVLAAQALIEENVRFDRLDINMQSYIETLASHDWSTIYRFEKSIVEEMAKAVESGKTDTLDEVMMSAMRLGETKSIDPIVWTDAYMAAAVRNGWRIDGWSKFEGVDAQDFRVKYDSIAGRAYMQLANPNNFSAGVSAAIRERYPTAAQNELGYLEIPNSVFQGVMESVTEAQR